MTSLPHLKPCPFCGNEGTVVEIEGGWIAGCDAGQLRLDDDVTCRANAIGFYHCTREGAIAAWNRRVPAMTNVTPLTQSPHGTLLSALQILDLGPDLMCHIDHEQDAAGAFGDAARLLRDALTKLGEPHPHTVELTRRYLEASAHDFGDVTDQEARDLAMVVITSALKWEAP